MQKLLVKINEVYASYEILKVELKSYNYQL